MGLFSSLPDKVSPTSESKMYLYRGANGEVGEICPVLLVTFFAYNYAIFVDGDNTILPLAYQSFEVMFTEYATFDDNRS